jgi:hypothetical protein
MIKLSEWEQFGVSLVLSLLVFLSNRTTNATALAGIQSTETFLQSLLSGQVPTE